MNNNIFDLEGRVAVVTGACGQLGGEFVKTLISFGASVAAFDVDLGNPKSQLVGLNPDKLIKVEVDVTDRNSIKKGLEMVLDKLGEPRILVNNAGVDSPPGLVKEDTGVFEQYTESNWDKVMDVNIKGAFLCCQVIGGRMVKTGGGSIINISSIYGMLSPDQRLYEINSAEKRFYKPVAYSVSKSGLVNLTRYLATYWADKKVRVNTLTLGGVFNNQDKQFIEKYSSRVPLGRMACQEECGGIIVFLASDASSYMTGSNLVLDGGYSCW
ncbi:MAG: SDR family oxidoreductase [Methanobacteriota archaeon]